MLNVISPEICEKLMVKLNVFVDHPIQLCALQPKKRTGVCYGDSGGEDNIILE